jgi:hypothetical protein
MSETRTAVNPGRSAALATSATSTSLGPLSSSGMIRLIASVDTYITFGNASVVAAAATGSLAEHTAFLPAYSTEYFAYDPSETYVAAKAVSGTGTLYITEMN